MNTTYIDSLFVSYTSTLIKSMQLHTFLILSLLMLSIWDLNSQSLQKYNAVSTSQVGGRFEIVQSEILRSNTFKVDKYEGNIFVYVKTQDDWFGWQEVPRSSSLNDLVLPDKINYQLFMGGVMASDCFFLNINTGVTWILIEDKKGSFSFQKLD